MVTTTSTSNAAIIKQTFIELNKLGDVVYRNKQPFLSPLKIVCFDKLRVYVFKP